jgi:hypothetical protein
LIIVAIKLHAKELEWKGFRTYDVCMSGVPL